MSANVWSDELSPHRVGRDMLRPAVETGEQSFLALEELLNMTAADYVARLSPDTSLEIPKQATELPAQTIAQMLGRTPAEILEMVIKQADYPDSVAEMLIPLPDTSGQGSEGIRQTAGAKGSMESGWLPWKTPTEFFQGASRALASQLLGGVIGMVSSTVLSLIFGGSQSTEELLEAAVEQFGKVVHEEFKQQKLTDAQNALRALSNDLLLFGAEVQSYGSRWWEGPATLLGRVESLTTQSGILVQNLMGLELLGWTPFMFAASLRLRILATRMEMPGHEGAIEAIRSEIEEYVKHHWAMCSKYQTLVFSTFGSLETREQHLLAGKAITVFYFRININDAYRMYHQAGYSDSDWLKKIPVTEAHYPFPGSYHHIEGTPWWLTCCPPQAEYCVQSQPGDEGAALQSLKQTAIDARDRLMYWLWSHYYHKIVQPLAETVLSWWSSAYVYTIGRVELRAWDSQYVLGADTSSGSLSIWRDKNVNAITTFYLVYLGNDQCALCSADKQFLSVDLRPEIAEAGMRPVLSASRSWIRGWETFNLVQVGDYRIALRGRNGKFVLPALYNLTRFLPIESMLGWPRMPWRGSLVAESETAGDGVMLQLCDLDHNFPWLSTSPPPGGGEYLIKSQG